MKYEHTFFYRLNSEGVGCSNEHDFEFNIYEAEWDEISPLALCWQPIITKPSWKLDHNESYALSLEGYIKKFFNDEECLIFELIEIDCAVWTYPKIIHYEKRCKWWQYLISKLEYMNEDEWTAKVVGCYSKSKNALIYFEYRSGLKIVFRGKESSWNEFRNLIGFKKSS